MKPSYYAIIPADVRYSNLKPNAKLLYGEITALSSKEGYCFATNNYFATLYGVPKNPISLWVSQLNKQGFISVELIKKGEQITERRLGIIKKEDRAQFKNDELSSTRVNTTNNIYIRIKKFKDKVIEDSEGIINSNESQKFLDYWSELNKSKTKMRWELERTWDLKARLQRWKSNNIKWNEPKKVVSKIRQKLNVFNNAKEKLNKINNAH